MIGGLALAALLVLATVSGMVIRGRSPHREGTPPPAQPKAQPTPESAVVPTGQPAGPGAGGAVAGDQKDPLKPQWFTTDCYMICKPSGWELLTNAVARVPRNFAAARQLPGADALLLTIDVYDLPPDTTLADFSRQRLDAVMPAGATPAEDTSDLTFKNRPTRRVVVKGDKTEAAICFFLYKNVGFAVGMAAPTGRVAAHQSEFDEALNTFEFIEAGEQPDGGPLRPQVFATDVYMIVKPAGWRHDVGAMADGVGQFWAIKELPEGGGLRLYIGVEDLVPGKSLQAFSDERIESIKGMQRKEDTTKFTFAGEPARRVLLTSAKGDLMWYFFLHKDMGFEICMEAPAGRFAAHQRDFDEALRTFKLVEGGPGAVINEVLGGEETPPKGG